MDLIWVHGSSLFSYFMDLTWVHGSSFKALTKLINCFNVYLLMSFIFFVTFLLVLWEFLSCVGCGMIHIKMKWNKKALYSSLTLLLPLNCSIMLFISPIKISVWTLFSCNLYLNATASPAFCQIVPGTYWKDQNEGSVFFNAFECSLCYLLNCALSCSINSYFLCKFCTCIFIC